MYERDISWKKWHSRVSPFINGDFNYFFHSFLSSDYIFFLSTSFVLALSPYFILVCFFILGDVNKTLGSFPLWFIKRVFFSRWVEGIKKKRNIIYFDTIRFDSVKFDVLFLTLMSPKVFSSLHALPFLFRLV